MPRVDATVAAALGLAARGLAVFRLRPGARRPEPGWQELCTTDPLAISCLFRAGDNIGVGCRASNVVGIDLDVPDGAATFGVLATQRGNGWPDTLTVRTPRGGLHLYFRPPPGRAIASTSGVLAPGIDVRGPGRAAGGYLIGPGSTVNGSAYVIARDAPIADLPGWLAPLLTPGPRRAGVRCR